MKSLGMLLVIVGAIWLVFAFNSDTTVATESQFIGSTFIPSHSVNNIGKMDDRRNHIMVSSMVIVIGVILFAMGNKTNSTVDGNPNSHLSAKSIERFEGERDITTGKYQLYLTRKYTIERNTTLDKYIVNDSLFDSLNESLSFANELEEKYLASDEYNRQNSDHELMREYNITLKDGMYILGDYHFDKLADALLNARAARQVDARLSQKRDEGLPLV